ncbi:prefoldin subunit 5, partial [Passer montanus]|uniref:prefoldin subunit 5 n=1 Tax=Passer montanus TaxID=9160 RepID=UPI0019614A1C
PPQFQGPLPNKKRLFLLIPLGPFPALGVSPWGPPPQIPTSGLSPRRWGPPRTPKTPQEVEFLSSSLAQLKVVQTKFVEAKECLNVLHKGNEGKDLLVPLTSSMYVPGKLQDVSTVLVDVGTGYYVEKVGRGRGGLGTPMSTPFPPPPPLFAPVFASFQPFLCPHFLVFSPHFFFSPRFSFISPISHPIFINFPLIFPIFSHSHGSPFPPPGVPPWFWGPLFPLPGFPPRPPDPSPFLGCPDPLPPAVLEMMTQKLQQLTAAQGVPGGAKA